MHPAIRLAFLACAFVVARDTELEAGEAGECHAGDSECLTVAGASAAGAEGLRWRPQTLSVVLACASEGEFARRTIEAVSNSVPGGSGGSILVNIVVVDDASTPPLAKTFLPRKFRKQFKVTLVRNKKQVGLIRAKSMGAAEAVGDIIVFFDCHVAPQKGWHQEFLQASAENYRRVVVPQITDLDIDTWTQRHQTQSSSKCYLTWDADFKWFTSSRSDMPVLSGGLLGISRRWWNETGGYDEGMDGWGGENVDQSLRTWLCGGEIKSLSNAFVAHMWRVPSDNRTMAKYTVSPWQALRNRARAVKGWFGNFSKKLDHYPDMRRILEHVPKDLSAFRAVKERLGCRPFEWFLWRFRDVYEDAGLLPDAAYRIKHTPTGSCLTFLGPAGTHPHGFDAVELQPCGKAARSRRWPSMPPDPQRWHLANQDPKTGKCCSGLGMWSTDQCLSWDYARSSAGTRVCDIAGRGDQSGVTGASRWPKLAPGQLVIGGSCISVQNGKLQRTTCRNAVKPGEPHEPAWEEVEPQVPLETKLYRKAREERPQIFQESEDAAVDIGDSPP